MPTKSFKVGEMLNERTRNTKTWMNFDGTYTMEIHTGDVHFADEYGTLQNINTDLYDEADFDVFDEPVSVDGKDAFKLSKMVSKEAKQKNTLNRSNHGFQALRVPFDAHIPRNFQRGYSIGKGKDKLTFTPVKGSPSTSEPSPNNRSVIVYQDVWADTDVELKVQPNGLKETLYLKTSKAPTSFRFEVKGRDIADDFTAGELKLLPAWLEDANGTYRDVEQKIVRQNDNKVYVELVADVTDLVYPIAIDPTVIYSDASADAYVYKAIDYEDTNFGSENFLDAFKSSSERESYIYLDIPEKPASTELIKSELKLFRQQYSTYVLDQNVDLRVSRVTGEWAEGTVTWNNKPAVISDGDPLKRFTPSDPFDLYVSFDVTNITKSAVIDGAGYNGFHIQAEDYYGLTNNMRFNSTENTEGNAPYLEVTYSAKPTAPVLIAPNGGERWHSEHTVSWEAATDADDAASVLKYEIQLSTDGGGSYSTIVGLTAAGVTSYQYAFSNEAETTSAKIRIRAYDGYLYGPWDESDNVFTIEHHKAPLIPTDLVPNGDVVNRAVIQRFTWTHNDSNTNDPQSGFIFNWREKGAVDWISVGKTSINEYYDMPAGTMPHGEIEWRVRTFDQTQLASPYSDVTVFTAGDKPATPTLTSPVDGETLIEPDVTFQWSSGGQVAYRITIKDVDGETVYDVQQQSTAKTFTDNPELANVEAYTVELVVQNPDTLWSDPHIISVTTSYTLPTKPTIETFNSGFFVAVNIVNPEASGTQPTVTGNDLYKRVIGSTKWKPVARKLINQYEDYAVASGEVYEYKARARGDNGTFTDSEFASSSVTLQGVFIHSVQDPAGTIKRYQFDGAGRSSNKQVEHVFRKFAGRAKPVVEFGESTEYGISASIVILRKDDGAEQLEQFVEARETVCYRDGRGRIVFGVITAAPLEDTNIGWSTTIDLTEIDYSEEV